MFTEEQTQELFLIEATDPVYWILIVMYQLLVIGHFTVVCLVTWPRMQARPEVDLALIQTSLLFSCKCQLVSIRTT